MTDPFHRQILTALQDRIDPLAFQACMCDLLRDIFPGLVPITGGTDGGMDGAVADGQGEPFPLVCTISKDVIGNLTHNLDSYLKNGGQRRQVVLATSQSLTPQRQHRLRKRAQEKGFVLLQVYEQSGVADRLYYSPRWCKELLGLSGTPPALSTLPRTRRPLIEIDLIGRDADVEWLKTTTGDRLITGQPGSGKTFLLHHLAREGWGLFLVGDDRAEIADALRQQRTEIIIVDDAHEDTGRLQCLRYLRREMNQDFAIVATCWEGERNAVAEALESLDPSRIRPLELLTRQQILEILRQAGVRARDDFLRELVDQAANKPGLATTLAVLWLRGAWMDVLQGEALSRSLMTELKRLVGDAATDFLAALSIGGDHGMPLAIIQEFLGLDLPRTRKLAIDLAAGGVLSEVGKNALAVRPRALRSALLRHVFFQGSATDHDYRPLLVQAPSFASAALSIVTAKSYGAKVPSQELRRIVSHSGSTKVWQAFAALGEDEARWALDHYPGDLLDLAREILAHVPRVAIPKLLERAVGETGPLHSQPTHPLRLLKDWIEQLDVAPAEAMRRRMVTAKLAKRYLLEGGDRDVGIHALLLALSPRVEGVGAEPVGDGVIIRWGLLPSSQLHEMQAVWEEGRDAIKDLDPVTWRHLKDALWGWIYPRYAAGSSAVPEGVVTAMHTFAGKVLRDLTPLARESPGLITDLTRLAGIIGLDLLLEVDPVFELLYPSDYEKLEEWQQKESADLRDLAKRWASKGDPHDIAKKLALYLDEATRIGHRKWPPRIQTLCRFMAETTQKPEQWLGAFLDLEMPGDLLEPFLQRAMKLKPSGWEYQAERCLGLDSQAWAVTSLILEQANPPAGLLNLALTSATRFPEPIETLCLRTQVPIQNLKALLASPDQKTALAAAVGEWHSTPRGHVREEVNEEWRSAILSYSASEESEYLLEEIFAENSEIAFAWLQELLKSRTLPSPSQVIDDNIFDKAVGALEERHRIAILDELEDMPDLAALLPRLIDRRPMVYERLLAQRHLRRYHLVPLEGIPDSAWKEMALLALARGYEPPDIAGASFSLTRMSFIWGSGQDHWSQWDQAFAVFEDHPEEELREVARHGRRIAQNHIHDATSEQRRDELCGP